MSKVVRKLRASLKSQSTLELTVALIAVFILLLGAIRLFIWLNERMVLRQEAFEATRVPRDDVTVIPGYYLYGGAWIPPEYYIGEKYLDVDESALPPLDILGEGED